MLRPRITPCLLIKDKGLVKTIKFKDPKYIGDPINAVKIFNEKEVDELVVLDIYATKENREPDYKMIENLAAECRMPFCYGGGIKTVEQALRIFSLGVEKVALSSVIIDNPSIISRIAGQVGSQSIVAVLDIKQKQNNEYEIFNLNGSKATSINPVEFCSQLEQLGVGEIILNSIDNDGIMKGYDLTLVNQVSKNVNVPITVLGGAGSLDDIGELIREFGIIGAAAGSLFVYKGKYKAVLINYPNKIVKDSLVEKSCNYFKGLISVSTLLIRIILDCTVTMREAWI